MTARLLHLWGWVGHRRLIAGWVVAIVGLLSVSGGVVLGATKQGPDGFPTTPATAVARPRSTMVEALVLGRRPNGFVARTRAGDLLLVRTSATTTYRAKNKAATAAAVKRGARVIILGRAGARESLFNARAVSIRSQTTLPPPTDEGMGLQ